MSYNPSVKVYYTKGSIPQDSNISNDSGDNISTQNGDILNLSTSYALSPANRLIPAPTLTINPELYYANDSLIGYTYTINLNGYATSIDLVSNTIPTGVPDGFSKTLGSIQKIKNLFNFNNGILSVVDDQDKLLIQASGCIVRGLDFEPNENNWVNYAQYKVILDANELFLANCSGNGQIFECGSVLPSGIIESDSPNLIDMVKHKVKSFNDGWTFNLNENIYDNYKLTVPKSSTVFNLNNQYFEANYSITAKGKHYTRFKTDSDIFVTPAWENAKNFCQDRLTTVVQRLVQNVLKTPDQDKLQDLFAGASGITDSLLYSPTGVISENIGDNKYGVYNETITTDTSESEGTFTANYKAIIKRRNTTLNGSVDTNNQIKSDTLVTLATTRDVKDDGLDRNINISVRGDIQGLVEGGIVRSTGVLSLPSYGTILIANTNFPQSGKYEAALIGYTGLATKSGLVQDLAKALSITYSGLIDSTNVGCPSIDVLSVPPAASHSVSHNYNEGSITFTTEYNTKKASQGSDGRILAYKITFDEPIPRIAEFIIPGRKSGPIIQRIGTDTPRYMTVDIDGYTHNAGCVDPKSLITNICTNGINLPENSGFPLKMIFDDAKKKGMKLLENRYNYNRTDGSFSLTRKYLCYDYTTPNTIGQGNPGRFNPNNYEATGDA
jgi:hypothetical protein